VPPTSIRDNAVTRLTARLSLISELTAYEADKRHALDRLARLVRGWASRYDIQIEDLDEHGAPRVDRCSEAAREVLASMILDQGAAMDRIITVHRQEVARLRTVLNDLQGDPPMPSAPLGEPDGVAVAMAMGHALTMMPRLEPTWMR